MRHESFLSDPGDPSRGVLVTRSRLVRGLCIATAVYAVVSLVPAPGRADVGLLAAAAAGSALTLVVTLVVTLTLARRRTGSPTGDVERAGPPPDRSGPAVTAAAQAGFLRSFDQLEEVLFQIIDENATAEREVFTLHDCVRQLGALGFLGPDDLTTWRSCLEVRHQLLSAAEPTPGRPVVEQALSRMIHLQVTLTNRRVAHLNGAGTPCAPPISEPVTTF